MGSSILGGPVDDCRCHRTSAVKAAGNALLSREHERAHALMHFARPQTWPTDSIESLKSSNGQRRDASPPARFLGTSECLFD